MRPNVAPIWAYGGGAALKCEYPIGIVHRGQTFPAGRARLERVSLMQPSHYLIMEWRGSRRDMSIVDLAGSEIVYFVSGTDDTPESANSAAPRHPLQSIHLTTRAPLRFVFIHTRLLPLTHRYQRTSLLLLFDDTPRHKSGVSTRSRSVSRNKHETICVVDACYTPESIHRRCIIAYACAAPMQRISVPTPARLPIQVGKLRSFHQRRL